VCIIVCSLLVGESFGSREYYNKSARVSAVLVVRHSSCSCTSDQREASV